MERSAALVEHVAAEPDVPRQQPDIDAPAALDLRRFSPVSGGESQGGEGEALGRGHAALSGRRTPAVQWQTASAVVGGLAGARPSDLYYRCTCATRTHGASAHRYEQLDSGRVDSP